MNWFKNIFSSKDKTSIIVEGVNPQTENEFKFFDFVQYEPITFLEGWYKESKKLGHSFKPQYENAIKEKIKTGVFQNPFSFPEYFNSQFDYIAIDFETANNNRVSACAIGLAFVKNETFVHKEKHYIKPPVGEKLLKTHTRIHGIQESDLEFSSNFKEIWNYEFVKYFNNNLIIFHNASMDLSVLRILFDHYKIDNYSIDYLDTMKLAEITGNSKKLTDLASKFGIEIKKHHDPKVDAEVCASIFSELIEQYPNYRSLIKTLGIERSQPVKPVSGPDIQIKNQNLNIIKKYSIDTYSLESLVVEGKGFLFTGEISEKREDCQTFILENGGLVKPGITSKVDFVILGADYGWSKIQKIDKLNEEKKCNIQILFESDFKHLKDRYSSFGL